MAASDDGVLPAPEYARVTAEPDLSTRPTASYVNVVPPWLIVCPYASVVTVLVFCFESVPRAVYVYVLVPSLVSSSRASYV